MTPKDVIESSCIWLCGCEGLLAWNLGSQIQDLWGLTKFTAWELLGLPRLPISMGTWQPVWKRLAIRASREQLAMSQVIHDRRAYCSQNGQVRVIQLASWKARYDVEKDTLYLWKNVETPFSPRIEDRSHWTLTLGRQTPASTWLDPWSTPWSKSSWWHFQSRRSSWRLDTLTYAKRRRTGAFRRTDSLQQQDWTMLVDYQRWQYCCRCKCWSATILGTLRRCLRSRNCSQSDWASECSNCTVVLSPEVVGRVRRDLLVVTRFPV